MRFTTERDDSDMSLTTADIAAELNCTPKHLRKFLRADARATDKTDTLPGKGGRYSFEKKDLRSLKSRYIKWNAEEARKRAEMAANRAKDAETAASTKSDIEDNDLELTE